MHHRQCARRPRARVCVYVPFRWLSIRDGIHGGVDDGSRHGRNENKMLSLLFYFYETSVVLHQQERIWNIGFFFHIRQMHLLEYWQCDQSRYLECCIYTVRASDVRRRGSSPKKSRTRTTRPTSGTWPPSTGTFFKYFHVEV